LLGRKVANATKKNGVVDTTPSVRFFIIVFVSYDELGNQAFFNVLL